MRAVLGLAGSEKHQDSDGDDEDGEDNAAVKRQDRRLFGPGEPKYVWLYAVEVDGGNKRIFNNLPKAVAVLGNSKRVFFSHLHVMLTCLDPALAELCYIDTDSCLWSLTYQTLEECILDEKRDEWRRRDIIADEDSERSCHGKLKLEGTYRGGLFKTTKIYRLFDECVYTRCKGVNRYVAERLENRHFDVDWNSAVTVHRTCLRPTRTGEIVIASEARSLSVPFNLKRHVTPDGVHTLPFSAIESQATVSSDEDDDSSSRDTEGEESDPDQGGQNYYQNF